MATDSKALDGFDKARICVVVPCYNEADLIAQTLKGIPDFVGHIVAIDDHSQDDTVRIITEHQRTDPRVHLIAHRENQGVGGAIASGYIWARDNDMDVAVVMAGDNQMDASELPSLIRPVLDDGYDYVKGNRLMHQRSADIPKVRFIANAALSFLTKIASGYWNIVDSQAGYAAISKHALHDIDWTRMYKRYGQPNDILVTLNIHDMRVRDVLVKPIYGIGEKSGIKPARVIWPIGKLLVRRFWDRMFRKYILRDFHPLVLFYSLSTIFFITTVVLFIRLVILWSLRGSAPDMTAIAFMFAGATWLQSLFFAMWMDMEANRHLR